MNNFDRNDEKKLLFALPSVNENYEMKRITILKSLFFLSLGCTLFIIGCGIDSNRQEQGVIVYDVSFPYLKDKVLLNVFPEEMVFSFKGDQTHGMLKSLGGIVASEFIANEKEKKFSQLLKAFQDRYAMDLNEKEVAAYVKTMPSMTFEPTNETDTIAGYLCQKTIANFQLDSVPSVILYHTKEIGLNHPNWFTQYHEIEGVLLGYEVEQYGMRMKLTATSVNMEDVEDELFTISPSYQRINPERMKLVIDSLIGNFGAESAFN